MGEKREPSRAEIEQAVAQAEAIFQGEMAQYAAAHEILGLEWGDLFPLLQRYQIRTGS